MQHKEGKHWSIREGMLVFENGGDISIPTADEIYSAVFENSYSDSFTELDLSNLGSYIYFSKYPLDLDVVLEAIHDKIKIMVTARADGGKEETLSANFNADHIIIDNTWYPLSPTSLQEVSGVLATIGVNKSQTISLGQYLTLLRSGSEIIKNRVSFDQLGLAHSQNQEPTTKLNATLYPYQQKGWQWLRFLRNEKVGGILADEMGLGKSLQIIALLNSEKKDSAFPSLIIAPTTLLENWKREFKKFTPDIITHIHQGAKRTGFPNDLIRHQVIITSYDTIVRDSSLFNEIAWKIVICDEAQAIKNPATRRAKSAKAIQRETSFAVTGTPIENKLTDLWSIMDFALPGFLGSQSSFDSDYQDSEEGANKLQTLITPLILRRRISEVATDLPAKIIIPQVLTLSENEIESYEQIRQQTMQEFESNYSLVVLSRLRTFCTHPFLSFDRPKEDPAAFSIKYSRFIEIAEEIVSNGAKMLVFTSFNKMNDIINSDFKKRFGIYAASIDGRTPAILRQGIVDEFSGVKGAGILVLNPIAAGSGLNITSANHVIHYNLEWNPAKEDQASARAYRRGQDRPVTIHRLFYANTVEEAINERLNRKRSLSGTAIVGVQGEREDYDDILKAINITPKNQR